MRGVHPVMVRVREVREAKKMTRPKLAKAAGIHTLTLLRWELGQTSPHLADLELVLQALDLELDPIPRRHA